MRLTSPVEDPMETKGDSPWGGHTTVPMWELKFVDKYPSAFPLVLLIVKDPTPKRGKDAWEQHDGQEKELEKGWQIRSQSGCWDWTFVSSPNSYVGLPKVTISGDRVLRRDWGHKSGALSWWNCGFIRRRRERENWHVRTQWEGTVCRLERPPQDLNWLAPWSGPSSLTAVRK